MEDFVRFNFQTSLLRLHCIACFFFFFFISRSTAIIYVSSFYLQLVSEKLRKPPLFCCLWQPRRKIYFCIIFQRIVATAPAPPSQLLIKIASPVDTVFISVCKVTYPVYYFICFQYRGGKFISIREFLIFKLLHLHVWSLIIIATRADTIFISPSFRCVSQYCKIYCIFNICQFGAS